MSDAGERARCDMGYLHPKPHKYVRESYWVDCGRYDGYWAESCKVCGQSPRTVWYCKQ